jgi:hypothetical protein
LLGFRRLGADVYMRVHMKRSRLTFGLISRGGLVIRPTSETWPSAALPYAAIETWWADTPSSDCRRGPPR